MRDVIFEVPDCNLKQGARQTPVCSLCIHGARHCNALERAAERARRASERRDHADLRAAASRDAGHPRGVALKNRRDGEAQRPKISGYFRNDSAEAGNTRASEKTDRISRQTRTHHELRPNR